MATASTTVKDEEDAVEKDTDDKTEEENEAAKFLSLDPMENNTKLEDVNLREAIGTTIDEPVLNEVYWSNPVDANAGVSGQKPIVQGNLEQSDVYLPRIYDTYDLGKEGA